MHDASLKSEPSTAAASRVGAGHIFPALLCGVYTGKRRSGGWRSVCTCPAHKRLAALMEYSEGSGHSGAKILEPS